VPGFLGQTLTQAETMLRETRKHSASAPLWCGECKFSCSVVPLDGQGSTLAG
jgi:hypothetical protein